MDDHMLGKLKRKGEPAPEHKVEAPEEAAEMAEPAPQAEASEGDDADTLRRLMEMYGKDAAEQPAE
jgi:hypothetical protein